MKYIPVLILSICMISCHQKSQEKSQDGKYSQEDFLDLPEEEPIEIKELSPVEYANWVENSKNGLKVKQQDGEFIYEIQYQPLEYLVVLQERKEQLEQSLLKQEIEKREGLNYFTFKLSTIHGTGIFSDKNIHMDNKDLYLLSGIQNDIKLLNGKDTLNCVMCHVELSNNLLPYDQCVLAFEKDEDSGNDITFLYRTGKYADGWIQLTVKRKDIKRIPKLKTI